MNAHSLSHLTLQAKLFGAIRKAVAQAKERNYVSKAGYATVKNRKGELSIGVRYVLGLGFEFFCLKSGKNITQIVLTSLKA